MTKTKKKSVGQRVVRGKHSTIVHHSDGRVEHDIDWTALERDIEAAIAAHLNSTKRSKK